MEKITAINLHFINFNLLFIKAIMQKVDVIVPFISLPKVANLGNYFREISDFAESLSHSLSLSQNIIYLSVNENWKELKGTLT